MPLLLGRWPQVVIIRESQFDVRSLELRGQLRKRIRSANRGKCRTVQRLLARAKNLERLSVWNRAVAHNLELQRNHALIAQAHPSPHERIPVTAHLDVHTA